MDLAVELLSDGIHFERSIHIEARTDLLQSSLVQRNKEKQQISVHRIVQDVVLATMDDTQKCTRVDQVDQVVRILWTNWPPAMPKPSKDLMLPHPKSTGSPLHVGR
ncbi:hypothetical protein ACMYSQ_003946 [Aspergillus niger]